MNLAVLPVHAQRIGAMQPELAENPVALPASWQTRRDYSRFPVSLAIALRALADAEATARLEARQPGEPLRIGFARELPQAYRGDLAKDARWSALPGGGWVASFSVRSPGAESVRLLVRAGLPDGARVRFFEMGNPARRYPLFKPGDFVREGGALGAESTANAAETRWSPSISGDAVGVEIEIPPSADPAGVSFSIVRASHIAGLLSAPTPSARIAPKNAESCAPVEVACKSLPDCPNSAVAKVIFSLQDGSTYVCTGTAVNSTRSSFDNFDTPYLLTANHCIDSSSAAASVETYWRYEYATCTGTETHPDYAELRGGAELVTSDPDSDASILRLRDALPNNVCLAAWDATGGWPDDTAVTSLHHPEGEAKQWAGGQINDTGLSLVDDNAVDTIDVIWTEGSTRPGSSGAGLFTAGDDGQQALIGQLSGGPEDCSMDSYGRFDRFFVNQAGVHLLPTDAPLPDDHGGSAADATGVLAGSETAGEIDSGSDADVFRIDITSRGTLTAYTTGSLDTVGRLKRADGSTVAFDDDGGGQYNFRIEADVAAGTYYVKVTGYDDEYTGAYRLHVEFVSASAAKKVLVPLFLSASALDSLGRQGFVRVFNRSNRSGEVWISVTDDSGATPGSVTLALNANETRAFNSDDLERGNADKGIAQGTGAGSGDWRLEFESELDIEVAAYIRTRDGFLTAMHDLAVFEDRTGAHHVPVFNPARNTTQLSRLRLINPDAERAVEVTITGYDDAGNAGQSPVQLRLLPGVASTLDAPQLEDGGGDLTGRLGQGVGKWRLFVEADGRIHVVNLLDSTSGDLTNLSLPGSGNYR